MMDQNRTSPPRMHWRWILAMAWRDSRHSRRRLLLYLSAMVIGIAALVSIRSFGDSLQAAVEAQARTLLGADLSVRSRTPFQGEQQELLDRIPGDHSFQTSFASMAFFPRQESTRLVQVRALEGGFPYYGRLKTRPAAAAELYQKGDYALVDETLMLQFSVAVGDTVRLGDHEFEILGRLLEIPGESATVSELAPRIYIPRELVPQTGLVQVGSRVRHTVYFKLPPEVSAEALREEHREELRRLELSIDTVEERKEEFSRELGNLSRFLGLVAFVALVLGGIGVASSIHLYIKQRISTIAILRCVGASPRQAFATYLVQAAAMGILAAALGALLGLVLQRAVPFIISDLIPFEIEQQLSGPAVLEGLLAGSVAALLAALIPLVPIRRISPLLSLRSDYESGFRLINDPLAWMLAGIALVMMTLFSLWYASTWEIGLGFVGGLVAVFLLLFAVAKLIIVSTRRFFPVSWSYEWRQGLANLYRPHNQTVVLLLAVGLGAFFMLTLYLTQQSLLQEVELVGSEKRPNLVFFDIQSDQKEEVIQLIDGAGLPAMQDVPVVTMRLAELNGVDVRTLLEQKNRERSRWSLVREYRSTYRDHLTDAETLLEGELQKRSAEGTVKVSLARRIAEELRVSVGDRLTFDVQGVPIETEVGSIREVEWRNFQPNFFVVFPVGVLEEAPQFHVVVTRAETRKTSAEIQQQVVRNFPNVSAIDLSLVLDTIDAILGRLTFVIQFMALFSILTAILVMVSSIVSGRFQRMRESTLLRTLGASKRQIHLILSVEYLFLGLFSALTGLLLAVAAGWALCFFVFDIAFVLDPTALMITLLVVVALTVLVGLTNSRGILNHPPLEVLRSEE